MIINCNCKHESQDKLHGKGRRVFNKTRKTAGTTPIYRCSVCSKEKDYGN